jgi:hypothetical protein
MVRQYAYLKENYTCIDVFCNTSKYHVLYHVGVTRTSQPIHSQININLITVHWTTYVLSSRITKKI